MPCRPGGQDRYRRGMMLARNSEITAKRRVASSAETRSKREPRPKVSAEIRDRHQVIKQVDVVLAMLLLGRDFSPEAKKRNFDYYDSLTTGDSSLSACVQGI